MVEAWVRVPNPYLELVSIGSDKVEKPLSSPHSCILRYIPPREWNDREMKTSAFTSIAYTHQAALWSARYHVNSCVSEPALWIHPWLLAGRLDDLDGEEGIMDLGWLAWLNIEIVTELEGPIICWGKREKIGGLSKTIFRWDVSVKKIHFWRNIKFTKISLQEILSDVWK